MTLLNLTGRILPLIVGILMLTGAQAQSADILSSWNDGPTRERVVSFVRAATERGGSGFIPPAERIAVFDNDGTLWAEQPVYFQVLFIADRIRALSPKHPEWQTQEPYASVLRGDLKSVAAGGEKALLELAMATHAGMSTDEFSRVVADWISTARHPQTGRLYTEMVYQPMLELLGYLRANGFKTFIVSGGGIEFMRPWVERVYGIPPEQVVGSSIRTKYEMRDGVPTLVRVAEIDFVDDKAGKPVGIHRHIGRRPVVAFGNSDGDLQMLQWTAAGPGPRLAVIVHHTDAEREWAYDRASHVGRLDRALVEADAHGWTVVDMRRDWRQVFAFQKQ